jgi:hypothetical protein
MLSRFHVPRALSSFPVPRAVARAHTTVLVSLTLGLVLCAPALAGPVAHSAQSAAAAVARALGLSKSASVAAGRALVLAQRAQREAHAALVLAKGAGAQQPAGSNATQGGAGLAGPQGPTGSQGAAGSIGPQGPAGPIGPQGPAGAAGPRGGVGAQGLAGSALGYSRLINYTGPEGEAWHSDDATSTFDGDATLTNPRPGVFCYTGLPFQVHNVVATLGNTGTPVSPTPLDVVQVDMPDPGIPRNLDADCPPAENAQPGQHADVAVYVRNAATGALVEPPHTAVIFVLFN